LIAIEGFSMAFKFPKKKEKFFENESVFLRRKELKLPEGIRKNTEKEKKK
jgi:hypothetical protein